MPTSTFNPIGYVQDRKPLTNRTGDIGQLLNYIREQERQQYLKNQSQINRDAWAQANTGAVEPVAYADVIPEAVKAMTGSDLAALASGFVSPQSLFKKTRADIFMGKGSKTWNKTAAERAIQMEAENIDPRTIWKETGTWRGPDDQWRQEIDDSGLHVRSTAERKEIADNLKARRKEIEGILKDPKAHQGLSPKELATEQRNLRAESRRIDNSLQDIHAPDAPSYSGSRAKYAFDHNPLFAAYPRLGDAVVRQDYVGEEYGLFSPDAISLNKALKRLGLQNSVTAHELQHGVQDTEGFARGGPPEEVAEFIEFAKKARKKANEITASRELRSMHESGLSHQEAIDAYKNKTGEDPSLSAFAYLNYTPEELEAQMADARREFAKYNVFSHFKDPFEGYRYLGGEAEARIAQARLKMTPEQRRAVFPEDSYDVPIDRLVNIYK